MGLNRFYPGDREQFRPSGTATPSRKAWPLRGSGGALFALFGTCLKTIFATGAIGPKGFNESALPLRHKNRLSVMAAESEVGRLLCGELYLARQFPLRGQHRDGALQDRRDKQIAFGVGAQAVDAKVVEPLHERPGSFESSHDPQRLHDFGNTALL